MKTQHTSEPWEVSHKLIDTNGCAQIVRILNEKGERTVIANISAYEFYNLSISQSNANAQRIVDCVNACSGISNEELADMAKYFGKEGRTYYTLVKDMREAQKQRDEMISILKTIVRDEHPKSDAYIMAHDALQKFNQ